MLGVFAVEDDGDTLAVPALGLALCPLRMIKCGQVLFEQNVVSCRDVSTFELVVVTAVNDNKVVKMRLVLALEQVHDGVRGDSIGRTPLER